LAPMASYVYKKFNTDLVTMHAADYRSAGDGFRIYVVFSLEKEDLFVAIRTSIDEKCIYRSLTPQGHPDLRPLVLYDDWPPGVYPLRKDFDPSKKVPRVPNEYHYKKVEGEGVFEIPVGPVHAGVIEPGHFRFSVAGEPVINLEIRLGYTHKGIEKLSEGLPYAKGVYLSERISGDNSV